MEMKQYLIETFRFNDHANKKMLEKISYCLTKQRLSNISVT
jgi:hypothetical protein